MKKLLVALVTILIFSTSPLLFSASIEAENAIHSLKLDEYLIKRGGEDQDIDSKKILVNILSRLPEIKMQEFTDFIKPPFHAKFIRALYSPQEKDPIIFQKFISNPRPLLKEDRLILIKKINEKIHFTSNIFLEELIKNDEYRRAQLNPEAYKVDNVRFERLLNQFYYRLNDFKGSELQYVLTTMLDSKGEKIIKAINETMIMFLKISQKEKKSDNKN